MLAAILAVTSALTFLPTGTEPVVADTVAPPASEPAPEASSIPAIGEPDPAPPVAPAAVPSSPVVSAPTTTEPSESAPAAPAAGDPPAAAGQSLGAAQIDVTHAVVALIPGPAEAPQYGVVDETATGVALWQKVRVAFQIVNSGSAPGTVAPLLQYREEGQDPFTAVPEDFQPGSPFRLSPEWVTVEDGTAYGPTAAELTPADFHIPAPGAGAVNGQRSMHANPAPELGLASGQHSEQEFTVSVTSDADPGTSYEFRLLDGAGGPVINGPLARLAVVAAAPVELTPGQQDGLDPGPVLSEAKAQGSPRYALQRMAVADTSNVHGPYSFATDQCATCHRTHTATSAQLTPRAGSVSTLCLMCHDGTGASTDVAAQYTAATPNDPATRSVYQHDALTPTSGSDAHTSAVDPEFGGVRNRHSECTDCHNPHSARGTSPTATMAGWTASGRLRDVSGVEVANGPAGSAPTYTYFATQPAASPALEYQICFKCHSGYTELPSNAGFPPSQQTLDKGIELNPANGSFHPVEAAGTNQTTAMAASLSGTSPYKLWNFTTASTVRCSNCHGDPASITTGPGADADLPAHTSTNRGILLANYRDRVLKPRAELYQAGDFALCYLCHAEQPYRQESSSATNFRYHFKHLNDISGGISNADIDAPGAGGGKAICAECHFRLHSSAFKVGTQSIPGSRLVNFAPDVQPITVSGVTYEPTYTRSGTRGTCTLTCHGARHFRWSY